MRLFAGFAATIVAALVSTAPVTGARADCPQSSNAIPTPLTADLLLSNGHGDRVLLSDVMPDGPVVLHFWATWCVPCRTELPALERTAALLARAEAKARLLVISIDGMPFERVDAFLKEELSLKELATWQVRNGKVGTTFQILKYPATLFIGADRSVRERYSGPVDWEDRAFRQRLRRHLELLD